MLPVEGARPLGSIGAHGYRCIGSLVIAAELIGADHKFPFANHAHGIYTTWLNDRTNRFAP